MLPFAKISAIDLANPASWQEKLFLTLDIDWVSDEILAYTIDLVEAAEVEATWFVTHDTPLLERLRKNPGFELGIHPNFNNLLLANSDANGKNLEEIIQRLLEIVPEAVSVRSHSLCQSSRILDLCKNLGLRYDCNHFIPAYTGIPLAPWDHWNGMVKVPHCWQDDVAVMQGFRESLDALLRHPGVKVLDFHPIHIALNTSNLLVYEESRPGHHSLTELQPYISSTYGARSYFQDLLSLNQAATANTR